MLLLLLSNQQPAIVYSGVVGGAPVGVLPVGSLSLTEVGAAAISVSFAGTLADATAVAVASSTAAAVAASLAATLGPVTLVATAKPFAGAVLAVTLENLRVQASAGNAVPINGSLAALLEQLTVSATSDVRIAGQLNSTLGLLTLNSSSTMPRAGQLNSTLGPATLNSTAQPVASTSLSSVLDQARLTANIGGLNSGSVNTTLGPLTAQAFANVRSFGVLSTTLSPALLNSSANVVVQTQLNRSLESVRLFASSVVYNDPPRFATLNSTLRPLTSVSTAQVKPFDPFKLLNFFDVELLTQIDAFEQEIEISPEYLAAFDTDNYRYALILTDGINEPEIVWVLEKNSKLFVLRGQEGTVARNWLAGTRIVSALTAGSTSLFGGGGGSGSGSGDGSGIGGAVLAAQAAAAASAASASSSYTYSLNASASADSSGASASISLTHRLAAEAAMTSAGTSASASATSATNASASATAAGASASAANTSRLSAEAATTTALGYMNGAELAAAGAATSSASAEIAKNDAVTAKTGALTAEASAISAKDLAVAAQVAATTQAGNSLSSANASASSATTATAQATLAQSSATASETSRLAAEAAQTGANNSAAAAVIAKNDAVTAKTDAQAASASASTSVTLAATSATSADNSATAAATSASNASTSATSAGSSASSATTSANTASVQAGNAAASASAAATSAALADSLTGALALRTTTLEAQMGNTSSSGLQARIATEETARATADTALATRATTLEAQISNTAGSGLQSRIATEESARASADSAQASQITTLSATVNANPNLFPNPTPIANRTPSQLGWTGTPITSVYSSGVGGLVYYRARSSGGSALNEAYQFDIPEPMTFSTGQQFTFSCYGYAGGATVGDRVYAYLDFRSADNSTSLYISPAMTLNSGGTRQSVTGTFPGSFTNGRLRVIFIREWPSSGSYQDVVFNMIKVECGPVATAFTNSAQVIVSANAIATLNDSAAFWQVLVAASGGDPAIVRLFSGLGGSEISLAARVLSLINTSSGVAIPVMRAIGGEAYFQRPISSDFGPRRLTVGPGYGVVGSEVVLWFGPSTIAPANQSRTNCIFALGTDGIVYYGGQIIEVGSMQATLNLYDVNLTRLGVGTTSQSMTATGYAPGTISYLWELLSGDAVNISSPTTATTNIGHSLVIGQTKTSVVKCTMTSSTGPSTFRLLNISSSEMS